ncbi:hypothetical protein JWR92_04770 [Lactiplantibacillus plantarum]|nr:hypothetical protein JWR92_04770 [Lactiplantibacillus plantarum]QXN30454.1 class I SAM-dependent methyltransferase [Lactiplantibacillus plantarum subsp. plantarum]QXN33420.1 class I SAM-dependent methyltransferase [Lactiplantibacillus plantarum subsp. plantarum]
MPKHTKKRATIKRKHRRMKEHAEANKAKAQDSKQLAKEYGTLDETWPFDLRQGFTECMRVLKPHGTLVFKWNEEQIKLSELLDAIGYQLLFGDKRGKTH